MQLCKFSIASTAAAAATLRWAHQLPQGAVGVLLLGAISAPVLVRGFVQKLLTTAPRTPKGDTSASSTMERKLLKTRAGSGSETKNR